MREMIDPESITDPGLEDVILEHMKVGRVALPEATSE